MLSAGGRAGSSQRLLWLCAIVRLLVGEFEMGAKNWESSWSGPDWTDVLISMKAIEDFHSVSLTITVVPGVFAGPAGMLTIAARSVSRDASVLGCVVLAMSGEWPCKDHKTMEACMYAGLLTIDHALTGKVWEQKTLA